MSKSRSQPNPQPGATLSLSDVLSTNTEAFIPQPVIDDVAVDVTPERPDFIEAEPAPQPQPAAAPHNPAMTAVPGAQYQQGYQEPPSDEPVTLSPDDLAIIAVNLFDWAQTCGFTWASKFFILNDNEKELFGDVDTSGSTVYEVNSREQKAMAKLRKVANLIKELPLQDDEKRRLQDAGIIYARTMNVQVTPFQALMASVTSVLAERGTKIFNNSL
ncbi:hypothetical protein HQ865_01250 [Mucilaginibacter mali]|uniref:Uncharacterized protein n=1 Tax=Mucilaginibacter mali TaxID=2740462 RepID=A0A7D4UKJ2_9SPHI|nr:hypothetical protein [Mucilaginibacter mali]QKJ28441.1 hypothetical protein HQ865_01250 [Mucilaginibacter mali]